LKDRPVFIGVIGGRELTAQVAGLAEEVGREIAKRGAVLVCGGLGGVMEAACRGASAEGGLTIGILPGDDRRDANHYVRIPIVTGLGAARNVAVVMSSQAVIAVDGSYGTLSEIGHALQSGVPVIGLDTWSLSREGEADTAIVKAATPAQAVDAAMSLIERNLKDSSQGRR
jgi:uncharacterized protein (TIGR00725 family)